MEAKDVNQAGELKEPPQVDRASHCQGAAQGTQLALAHDQHTEAGRVHEADAHGVHEDLPAALSDCLLEGLAEGRR